MTGRETIKQLREIEAECLSRFRARTRKLATTHPGTPKQILFAMAVEAMPKTANRYQLCRAKLAQAGIAALPLE